MKALVCGGAGYIGSHMVRALAAAGHDVLIIDDLSTGHAEAVHGTAMDRLSLLDEAALERCMALWKPDVVFHFAALSIVSASVADPLAYYRNNVTGTGNLLACMRRHGVSKIVFSSTAAVYGLPCVDVIDELQPLSPINPYGTTKMVAEVMLADAFRAYGLRSVSLRYFNAAGADPSGQIGEAHAPETHLIPCAIAAAMEGNVLTVFGNDYQTVDGTCVRDYVHVCDLVQAHLLAATYIDTHDGAYRCNLGTGAGSSVMDIVAAVARVVAPVDVVFRPRRPGDPDRLVASSVWARQTLGWEPVMSDLETIVGTAAHWHAHRSY